MTQTVGNVDHRHADMCRRDQSDIRHTLEFCTGVVIGMLLRFPHGFSADVGINSSLSTAGIGL